MSDAPPHGEPTSPSFEDVVLRRRAVRHFDDRPLPDGLLARLLALCQRAPSGYNLQPWCAVVVTDPTQRQALQRAALGQVQVAEAPAVVVFAADTRPLTAWPSLARQGVASGHWSRTYARRFLGRYLRVRFDGGPLRVLQPLKAWVGRVLSSFRPSPTFPIGRAGARAYTTKQTAFAVQTFLLAAAAHDVDTCPMEGFDPRWVRRVVGLSRRWAPAVIVPVGFAADPPRTPSPRRPTDEVFFDGRYGEPLDEVADAADDLVATRPPTLRLVRDDG